MMDVMPLLSHNHSYFKPQPSLAATRPSTMTIDDLQSEVYNVFERHLYVESLLTLSRRLQAELLEHMQFSPQCMLPSFNYELPSGQEQGAYLAVEVGGSNLRVALVDLRGRGAGDRACEIRRNIITPIPADVKAAEGYTFFDWMAQQIRKMLEEEGETRENAEPMRMGVAWSFPIDQTSIGSGNVLGMGKGFRCTDLIKDRDLGTIFKDAFKREHVNVSLEAIVNDTSSSLLARAYLDPTTRIALVLGTGMNAAAHLPMSALHPSKFELRPVKPTEHETHVLVNTELSMFGKNILPSSKWDDALNAAHMMPNYQPLEYMIGGGYMGEIVRLIIVDAVDRARLFNGHLPQSLRQRYSLDTKTIATIQADTSADLIKSRELLHQKYPSLQLPSIADATFLQNIITSVSHRAVAYFAVGVHALTALLQDLDAETGPLDHLSVGCDGSVINKYPAFMRTAQEKLDGMWRVENNGRKRALLEEIQDGSVLGAGVAGALGALASAQA